MARHKPKVRIVPALTKTGKPSKVKKVIYVGCRCGTLRVVADSEQEAQKVYADHRSALVYLHFVQHPLDKRGCKVV